MVFFSGRTSQPYVIQGQFKVQTDPGIELTLTPLPNSRNDILTFSAIVT